MRLKEQNSFIEEIVKIQGKARIKLKKVLLTTFSFLSWGALFLCFCPLVYASSIGINPIRLILTAQQKITSFEINNDSDQPLTAQLQVVKWEYKNGKDIHERTKDVLITPPIVKIAPRGTQIVRVGFLNSLYPQKGATYRVILQEVAPSASSIMGVHTLLKIILPLLVDPPVPIKPTISFSASYLENKGIKVQLYNRGENHFQIRKITCRAKDKPRSLVEKEIFNYLIPSQKKEWDFEIPESFTNNDIEISAETDQGNASEIVHLSSS